MGIVEFLTARLDEDEALARAATPGPWSPEKPFLSDVVTSALLGRVADCAVGTEYRAQSLEDARHIARHDPARGLREVEAKRRMMARHYADDDGSCVGCHFANDETRWTETIEECPELRDMASVYAEHPDYEQSWSVG